MQFPRESGILLHPTSLPGPHGIGDLGQPAFRFVEWLQAAGQQLWQVMPLGPTGYGDSPYASPSAFAGNPLLISLDWLAGVNLLTPEETASGPDFGSGSINFGEVVPFKDAMLRIAFGRFQSNIGDQYRSAFVSFIDDESWWLTDYAMFMAIKREHNLVSWRDWPAQFRNRDEQSLAQFAAEHADEITFIQFVQFMFEIQWQEVRAYANNRGIRIVGDIPIFVADDSSDVWASQEQFQIGGNDGAIAGVPPDPFSATGQIWGNPMFNWEKMREDDFSWWRLRISRTIALVDIIRIDHFRGFAAAWAVPVGSETAAEGHWEFSPGGEVFASIRRQFGDLPIIIEDLGVITPDVVALREILGFPGMNVLQFAFETGGGNVYLPHNYRRDSVVYTATHDNQTTVGWFSSRPELERGNIQRYLGTGGEDIAWDLIRLALASVANTAILSMQDVLRLGDDARMNVPGSAQGNWAWRCEFADFDWGLAIGLRSLVETYGRLGNSRPNHGANPWDYTVPGSSHALVDKAGLSIA